MSDQEEQRERERYEEWEREQEEYEAQMYEQSSGMAMEQLSRHRAFVDELESIVIKRPFTLRDFFNLADKHLPHNNLLDDSE